MWLFFQKNIQRSRVQNTEWFKIPNKNSNQILTKTISKIMKRVTENDHPSDHRNVAVNVWVAVHVTMRVTVAPFNIKSWLLWETTFFWKITFLLTKIRKFIPHQKSSDRSKGFAAKRY